MADEAISAEDSASFLIAQMTAFDIPAENAQHIADAVNEVANQFSVSSGDISNSLGNMSAVMAQTGASFEESLGIVEARSSKTGWIAGSSLELYILNHIGDNMVA